jgi:hypothetical protein
LTQISDFYGRTGPWPDPLYPVTMGSTIEVQENRNQPLWFRVEVPYGAAAGIYSGEITIGSAIIPYSLRVWDFSLPDVNYLDSKFGFDWDAVLEAYGGTLNGNPQACYQNLVDAINQTFDDYRLNPSPPDSPGAPEDVLIYSLTAYEINKAHTQQTQLEKQVWWELSPQDQPPLVNPAVMDRPGWDARMLPWLAWLDRVDGIYYHQTADWSFAPWTTPFTGVNNGDGFLFYPPKDETVGDDPCMAESNRLIPSIRLELLREGLEDYVYLWMLNRGKPVIDEESQSDIWASTIIDSRTSFSRIPTALNPIRIAIAELLELRQYAFFLPLVIR